MDALDRRALHATGDFVLVPQRLGCGGLSQRVDRERLADPVDYLSLPALREIDESLALLLDLDVV